MHRDFLKESERYFNKHSFKKDVNENRVIYLIKFVDIFFKDITDYTSGFICVKKNFFLNYSLRGFYGDYFLDLILQLKKENKKIFEIPFKDEERASGYSKTVVNINIKYLYTCLRYFFTLFKTLLKFKFNFD